MINNLDTFLSPQNIYLIVNWGIIPFWILLIAMPNHGITRFFAHSVVAPLILATCYCFIGYQIYLGGNIFQGFNLYLGLEDFYKVYSNELFLLIFWIHFLALSLFIGAWIARDASRYMIPRVLSSICLIATYFSGPVGIVVYWLIRIFYSKKINFNE